MSPIVRALRPARAIALVLSLGLAGCATDIRFGNDFDETAVTGFEVGKTTRADVIRVLGMPRGRGETYVPRYAARRDMMFYELVTTDTQAVDLKFLLILLDGDRYDGHFWFASSQLVDEGGV
ncbi:hypothetical protein H0I76_09360 [Limibaculum sp. M0105]|uniref:Outer membrane protein assembly factor BamE n=1 Tax=Thermohalobaculum xanthum TaxID=2753746 RepID=A0A8J7M7N6_9RHOB|nr:hypothetical protein [Thermohalobaculum xanthum]MBK0399397.1 hypothetical protein [Thermohalobaculum xanthum]